MQTADLRMNVAMAIAVLARAIVISLVGLDIVTTPADGPVLPMAIPPRFPVPAEHVPAEEAVAGAMRIAGGGVRVTAVSARRQTGVEVPEVVVTGAVVVHRAIRITGAGVASVVAVEPRPTNAVGRKVVIPSRVVRRGVGRRRADRGTAVADRVRALIITGRPGERVIPALFRGRGAMPAWGVRPKPAMAR